MPLPPFDLKWGQAKPSLQTSIPNQLQLGEGLQSLTGEILPKRGATSAAILPQATR